MSTKKALEVTKMWPNTEKHPHDKSIQTCHTLPASAQAHVGTRGHTWAHVGTRRHTWARVGTRQHTFPPPYPELPPKGTWAAVASAALAP